MALRIIAFEGIDGSGKTVQVNLLARAYEAMGLTVRVLSFPVYDSFFGRHIGAYLLSKEGVSAADVDAKSMTLWFALDRFEAFRDICLEGVDVLLINRYVLSNAVYQSIRDRDTEDLLDFVLELEHAHFGLPEPHAYIYLDVYTRSAEQNMLKRGRRDYAGEARDVYETQEGMQRRARQMYLAYAARLDHVRVVDCMEGDRQKPEGEIAKLVIKALADIG